MRSLFAVCNGCHHRCSICFDSVPHFLPSLGNLIRQLGGHCYLQEELYLIAETAVDLCPFRIRQFLPHLVVLHVVAGHLGRVLIQGAQCAVHPHHLFLQPHHVLTVVERGLLLPEHAGHEGAEDLRAVEVLLLAAGVHVRVGPNPRPTDEGGPPLNGRALGHSNLGEGKKKK